MMKCCTFLFKYSFNLSFPAVCYHKNKAQFESPQILSLSFLIAQTERLTLKGDSFIEMEKHKFNCFQRVCKACLF